MLTDPEQCKAGAGRARTPPASTTGKAEAIQTAFNAGLGRWIDAGETMGEAAGRCSEASDRSASRSQQPAQLTSACQRLADDADSRVDGEV